MPSPSLVDFELFVIQYLLNRAESSGREMRDALNLHFKCHMGIAAFYQRMALLEDADIVSGYYKEVVIGENTLKERCYTVHHEQGNRRRMELLDKQEGRRSLGIEPDRGGLLPGMA